MRVSLNKDTMQIGERILYNVEIRHSDSEKLIGEPVVHLRDFEVAEIRKYETERSGSVVIDRWEYAITTFRLDTTLDIPAPSSSVVTGADTSWIRGEATRLVVASVLDTSIKEIQPEKPPFEGEVNWWLLALYVGLVLAAAGGVIYLVVWLARRRKERIRQMPLPPVILRKPEEIALEELEKIRSRRLAEFGQYKFFHSEVSGVVRTYVESRYRVAALEMPTSELMRRFHQTRQLDSPHLSTLRALLEVADLVKFAKYKPTVAECEDVLDRAIVFVRDTSGMATVQTTAVP